MLFNSYVFVFAFLPITLLGWWSLPSKNARLVFLCLASYVFYGFWDWRFVPLMFLSSSADFIAGRAIAASEDERIRKRWLIGLLLFNLGILGLFKYYDFGAETVNRVAAALGAHADVPLLHLVLPIGISFYTFNSISYTIDIYRRRIEPAKNALEFSAFVAMFPHLVAGPIVRYSDMGDQFANLRKRADSTEIATGVFFFVAGLVKKVVVADTIAAAFVTPFFDRAHSLGLVGSWLATAGYTLQIYFDFSGYSDMAVGLALFLGLRFPQNFNSPYKSENVSEFWRRWHMSLSFWLRDYLFIPLGGSRDGKVRTMVNLSITMFLGGLWHGAAWTFVIWGLYHGALLAIHAVLKGAGLTPKSRPVSIGITLLAVMVGWVFFRAPTLEAAVDVLKAMIGLHGIERYGDIRPMIPGRDLAMMGLAGLIALFAPNTWEIRLPRGRIAAVAVAVAAVVCTLKFAHPSPFLYFQF